MEIRNQAALSLIVHQTAKDRGEDLILEGVQKTRTFGRSLSLRHQLRLWKQKPDDWGGESRCSVPLREPLSHCLICFDPFVVVLGTVLRTSILQLELRSQRPYLEDKKRVLRASGSGALAPSRRGRQCRGDRTGRGGWR